MARAKVEMDRVDGLPPGWGQTQMMLGTLVRLGYDVDKCVRVGTGDVALRLRGATPDHD